MMYLLASPQAALVHQKARSVLVSLLKVTRDRDPCAFRILTREIVGALAGNVFLVHRCAI